MEKSLKHERFLSNLKIFETYLLNQLYYINIYDNISFKVHLWDVSQCITSIVIESWKLNYAKLKILANFAKNQIVSRNLFLWVSTFNIVNEISDVNFHRFFFLELWLHSLVKVCVMIIIIIKSIMMIFLLSRLNQFGQKRCWHRLDMGLINVHPADK